MPTWDYLKQHNIISGKDIMFLKYIQKQFQTTFKKQVNDDVFSIVKRKKTLRRYPPSLNTTYPCIHKPFATTLQQLTYIKIKRINKLYKFVCAPRFMYQSYNFICDKVMNISYRKAKEILVEVREFEFDVYTSPTWSIRSYSNKFIEQKTIKNTKNNLTKYINRYEYQKYYIIYLLGKLNIPEDIVRLMYGYLFYK